MSGELEELIKNCPECYKVRQQCPQPLTPTPLPELPWQKVGTDLFDWKGSIFLLIVDYYSRFVEIAKLKRATADEVIMYTKSIFARHGIPEIVVSDNGPQFSSEAYAQFAEVYQFQHVTSSPYFPQSNGEAERAVGTVKSLLKKSTDPYLALLSYRSTPLSNGYSPSELLMCRVLRSTVPTTCSQRTPKIPDKVALQEKEKEIKTRQKENFDRRHGARPLPALSPGDTVWVPDQQTQGMVGEEMMPQSFEVTTENGTYRRNRRHLIRVNTPVRSRDDEQSNPPVRGRDDEQSNPPVRGRDDEHSNTPVRGRDDEQLVDASGSTQLMRRSTRNSEPPNQLDPSWL